MVGHSKSDTRPEQYRLFIAIALPESVKHAIERAQNEFRAALPTTSIRWRSPRAPGRWRRGTKGRPARAAK